MESLIWIDKNVPVIRDILERTVLKNNAIWIAANMDIANLESVPVMKNGTEKHVLFSCVTSDAQPMECAQTEPACVQTDGTGDTAPWKDVLEIVTDTVLVQPHTRWPGNACAKLGGMVQDATYNWNECVMINWTMTMMG
jgi:hypothetical protein